jgi:hypothetical protein
LPEAVALGAIYQLAGSAGPDPRTTRLAVQEATLALVRHTVAARLFDRDLLAAHLTFCAQVAATVPVKRLDYRRSFADLPLVGRAIAADLNS